MKLCQSLRSSSSSGSSGITKRVYVLPLIPRPKPSQLRDVRAVPVGQSCDCCPFGTASRQALVDAPGRPVPEHRRGQPGPGPHHTTSPACSETPWSAARWTPSMASNQSARLPAAPTRPVERFGGRHPRCAAAGRRAAGRRRARGSRRLLAGGGRRRSRARRRTGARRRLPALPPGTVGVGRVRAAPLGSGVRPVHEAGRRGRRFGGGGRDTTGGGTTPQAGTGGQHPGETGGRFGGMNG